MAHLVQKNPFVVATTDGKLIEEAFGLSSTGDAHISIAHMMVPPGWGEARNKLAVGC